MLNSSLMETRSLITESSVLTSVMSVLSEQSLPQGCKVLIVMSLKRVLLYPQFGFFFINSI